MDWLILNFDPGAVRLEQAGSNPVHPGSLWGMRGQSARNPAMGLGAHRSQNCSYTIGNKTMKNLIKPIALAAAFLLPLPGLPAQAEKSPAGRTPRVVIEVTGDGAELWTAVLTNVENLRKSLGNATGVEVVVHGKALGLLVAKDNPVAERAKTLAEGGVVFAACENTMKRKNVTRDQLLPFAQTTDSGVAEVVRKQEAGWSYIKSGQ